MAIFWRHSWSPDSHLFAHQPCKIWRMVRHHCPYFFKLCWVIKVEAPSKCDLGQKWHAREWCWFDWQGSGWRWQYSIYLMANHFSVVLCPNSLQPSPSCCFTRTSEKLGKLWSDQPGPSDRLNEVSVILPSHNLAGRQRHRKSSIARMTQEICGNIEISVWVCLNCWSIVSFAARLSSSCWVHGSWTLLDSATASSQT